MMFVWPLLLVPEPGAPTRSSPPFLFLALLPVLVLVVLAELTEGGMDAKALAMLGVLTAVNAALRDRSAPGSAGVELVFFLLILAGRVFGPGFGFVLGCTSLFASALLTSGVGPWLPYQMLCAAWIGLGAGLLPAATPLRAAREIVLLVGLRHRVRLRLRAADEPVVVAVRARHRGARPHRVAVLRRRRAAGGEPAPVPRLHAAHLDRRLGHRPRDHQLGRHRGARAGGAGDAAPGGAPGVVRRRRRPGRMAG